MSCEEVVTFWLNMRAPMSLLSRGFARGCSASVPRLVKAGRPASIALAGRARLPAL